MVSNGENRLIMMDMPFIDWRWHTVVFHDTNMNYDKVWWKMMTSSERWQAMIKDHTLWFMVRHSWQMILNTNFSVSVSLFVWSLSMKVRSTVSHHCHCHLENFGWCPSLVSRQGWGFVLNMRSLTVLLSLVCLEVPTTFFLQKKW